VVREAVSLMVTADVRTADLLNGLVISVREAARRNELSRALRGALPDVKVRVSSEGLWVPAQASGSLLDVRGLADLRWSEEARRFAENRRAARAAHPGLRRTLQGIVAGGRAGADRALGDTCEGLDDHQRVNVAAMTMPGGYGLCLFDEQGAGKTVSMIFAFDILVGRDEADVLVIVAPKSMLAEWQRDFQRFRGDLYRVSIATGSRRQKAAVMGTDLDVLVTNFETTVSMEGELQALLRRHGRRAVLAVDESFYTKNLNARRTQSVRRLRELCGRAFVLCGTPAPNAPPDLVQQFNIVDFGITFDGISLTEDADASRSAVQAAIEERGLFVRHLKADVLPELPEKRFTRVLVPMQPRQEQIYRRAVQGLVEDLRAIDEETFRKNLTSYLARRSALLQICSHPRAVVDGYDELPAKLHALDALLEDLIGRRGEKVVLWSFYVASLEILVSRYARYNVVRYDGSVAGVEARREAVRSFQEDDGTQLFVGNPAAAGAGLTLHRARYAIYESMSNQAAHYLQSLDRIHRRGQQRQVEYLILLCDRTIEVEEYDRLRRKERASQELLRDQAPEPITRQAMLGELLRDPQFAADR
jgi:SNF2 family DNA or RNA helicase